MLQERIDAVIAAAMTCPKGAEDRQTKTERHLDDAREWLMQYAQDLGTGQSVRARSRDLEMALWHITEAAKQEEG